MHFGVNEPPPCCSDGTACTTLRTRGKKNLIPSHLLCIFSVAAWSTSVAGLVPVEETQLDDQKFAETVLGERLITREQLDDCLKTQRQLSQQGQTRSLRQIAQDKRLLSEKPAAQKETLPPPEGAPQRIGDFELLAKVGEGGMGAVYKARQVSMDRLVALKLLPEKLARNAEFVDRFYREARASARLDHSNIIRGIAVGEAAGFHYFAMEYVQGRSLLDMLKGGELLDLQKAVDLMTQITRALAHAHQRNVIHRDIKPSNVLVTDDGVAKLADLGLAKRLDTDISILTTTGSGLGTPYYMPPEQARDAKRADERSDVYALGATFYHLITGRVPFSGPTPAHVLLEHQKTPVTPPRHVRNDIPERLSLIIEKMMAKDPANRFEDAGGVLAALESVEVRPAKAPKPAKKAAPPPPKVDWYFKMADASGRKKVYRAPFSVLKEHVATGRLSLDTPARQGPRGTFMPLRSFHEFGGKKTPTRFASVGGGHMKADSLQHVYSEIALKEKHDRRVRSAKRVLKITLQIVVALVLAVLLLRYFSAIKDFFAGLF